MNDAGVWTFAAVLVTQLVVLVGMFRTRRDVGQINRAVNHQPDGEPTLVQRVIRLESGIATHRAWERRALSAIAVQIGYRLPPEPEGDPHGE